MSEFSSQQGIREAIDAVVHRQYTLEADIINAFIAMMATHSGVNLFDLELVIERTEPGVTKYWIQPKGRE